MADFDSFLLTDGVDYPQAAHIMQLRANALRSEYINTQTLSATKELTDNDLPFQLLSTNGTANYTVELPPEATSNHVFLIYNQDSADTITVKDDSGATTYTALRPNQWAYFAQIQGVGWTMISSNNYQSFTPSWTNLSVGNGTQTAFYNQVNGWVRGTIDLTFGTTTSISGNVSVAPPVTINPANAREGIGQATFYDATGSTFLGQTGINTSTSILPYIFTVSGSNLVRANVTSTAPFTWTTSDRLTMNFFYHA